MNTLPHIDVYYPDLNYVGRMWLDPLVLHLLGLLPSDAAQLCYVLGQGLILFIGGAFLCSELKANRREAFWGALCIAAACVASVGLDPYLLSMHWFPALAAVLIRFRSRPSLFNLALTLLVSSVWIIGSGPLLLFGSLLALALAGIPNVAASSQPASMREVLVRQPHFALVGCLLFVGSIMCIPVYEMPDYPTDGRVAPISPFTFRGAPSIGSWLHPPTLVWSAYQDTNVVYSIRFAVICALLCAAMAWCRRWSWRALVVLVVFFGAVALESVVEASASSYTPFQTLWRLIPGVGIADLPWMILPFGITIAFAAASRRVGRSCLAAVFFLTACFHIGTMACAVFVPNNRVIDRLVLPAEVDHFARTAQASSRSNEESIRRSPSGFVVDSFGDWILQPETAQRRSFDSLVRLVQGEDFDVRAAASINSDEAYRALDNNANTRWKTGRPQTAGDVFSLEFSDPVQLIKLVLSVKSVPADFPRGIVVRGSEDCGEPATLVDHQHWHGPVQWTDSGYPYLGPQSWVILDFAEQQNVRCLQFELTDGHPVFDWSIDEVKLYRLP